MDISTGVAIAGGAIASRDLVLKVLGPTADYLGGEIKNLVHKCNLNLSDVFNASIRKGVESQGGAVDARTAKAIIDDASYCDDELIKDYYGGFLCGSKSPDCDDEALTYVSILKGMSRVQVRTHFLIYSLLHKKVAGHVATITKEEDRSGVGIAMGLEKYFSFIGANQSADWEAKLNHVISGLLRTDLIGPRYRYGNADYVKADFPNIESSKPLFVVTPSVLGAELYLWAAGYQSANPNLILRTDEDILLRFPEDIRKLVKIQ